MDIAMILVGFLTHHLIALLDMRLKGNPKADLLFYVKHRPIKLTLSLIGCFIGYVLVSLEFGSLFDMALNGDSELAIQSALREVTAKYYITMFMTGYMSDSIIDKVGSMTQQKIKL